MEMTVRVLDDGFGNTWTTCEHDDCGLEIVRPGKVQCERCVFTDEVKELSEPQEGE